MPLEDIPHKVLSLPQALFFGLRPLRKSALHYLVLVDQEHARTRATILEGPEIRDQPIRTVLHLRAIYNERRIFHHVLRSSVTNFGIIHIEKQDSDPLLEVKHTFAFVKVRCCLPFTEVHGFLPVKGKYCCQLHSFHYFNLP